MTVRKTEAIRRGLRQIHAFAYADFEAGMADDPPRWNKREASEWKRAFDWLRAYGDNNADGGAEARIRELETALREIYEVYAGSDGFIPETAAEAYQQRLIGQMIKIAREALASKGEP